MEGNHSFYLVIKLLASKFPDDLYICGVKESRGTFSKLRENKQLVKR